MQHFLLEASIFLAAAVIAVPIAARMGLGSVLGYLLAGLVIGPGLGLVAETEDLQHFAEFGVVMMLFLIGLELEPRALWDMRHRLVGLGGLQIALTTAAVMGVAMGFGLVWQTSLAIGMIFALSSTAIVLLHSRNADPSIVHSQHFPQIYPNSETGQPKGHETMAYATDITARSNSQFGAWVTGMIEGLRSRIARRRMFNRTYAELASLSNRELADLGLNRSIIRRVAWQAAYEA